MKTTVYIQNLKCGGCEATIINKLSGLTGVTNVAIDHEDQSVTFEHNDDATLELVRKKLTKLGYPIKDEENSLDKKIKSYVSCAIGRVNKS